MERFISDQLKRELLLEGSTRLALSNLCQFQRDHTVAGLKWSGVEATSIAGNLVATGGGKFKEKTKSLVGDDGGVTDVVAVKRLQSLQVMPYPSIEHS